MSNTNPSHSSSSSRANAHLQPPSSEPSSSTSMQRTSSTHSHKSKTSLDLDATNHMSKDPATRTTGLLSGGFGDLNEFDSTGTVAADILYRFDDQEHGQDDEGEREEGQGKPRHRRTQSRPKAVGPDGTKSSTGPTEPVDPSTPDNHDAGEDEEDDDHLAWTRGLPFWKKPSEKWLQPFVFVIAIAGGMAMPPKLELYDQLACEELYYRNNTIVNIPAPSIRPVSSSLASSGPLPTGSASQSTASQAPAWDVLSNASNSTQGALTYVKVNHSEGQGNTTHADPADGPKLPNGPSDDKLCHSAPVLAESAALQMRLTVTTGILSVITTGWYSSMSDRYGRTFIVKIAVLGLVVQDITIMLIGHFPRDRLPFGNNFLLIGAVFEGIVGGYPTLAAAHQAYIADSTPAGTRAQVFGFFMALLFGGFALGPTLGGWLVSQTGSLMSVFYIATASHLIYMFFIYFVIPESSSRTAREKAQKEFDMQLRLKEEKWEANHRNSSSLAKAVAIAWERLQGPLLPLKMILPRRIEADEVDDIHLDEENSATAPLLGEDRRNSFAMHQEASASHISVSHISKKRRWDLNLFLLSVGNFTESMIIGIIAAKMLYAQQMFGWGAREVGIFMTIGSLSRVLMLSIILPVVIKLVHRPNKRLNLPQDANSSGREVLDDEGRPKTPTFGGFPGFSSYGSTSDANGKETNGGLSEEASTSHGSRESSIADEETDELLAKSWTKAEHNLEEMWTARAKHLRMIHDSKFDLQLARVSVFIMMVTYAALPFAADSVTYVVLTCLTSLGSGGGAAMSSLALALLHNPRDAGKLFGAWSVMGAIGQTVLGPFLFTYLFQKTAGTSMPYAIFILGAALFGLALVFLMLVRVRKTKSLPSLPPRPLSRPASTVFDAHDDGTHSRDSTLGPLASTKSKIRMKSPNVRKVFSAQDEQRQ